MDPPAPLMEEMDSPAPPMEETAVIRDRAPDAVPVDGPAATWRRQRDNAAELKDALGALEALANAGRRPARTGTPADAPTARADDAETSLAAAAREAEPERPGTADSWEAFY